MKRYKYIHFLWANETKFNESIARTINQKDLNPDSSLIITPHPEIFEKLKKYGNVVLDTTRCNLFNKYYKQCDWMFSHGFPKSFFRYLTYPWVKKRIVYRYWGGRKVFQFKDSSHFFYNSRLRLYKLIYEFLFRFLYDGMPLIANGGIVDSIDLSPLIRKTPMKYMSYCALDDISIYDSPDSPDSITRTNKLRVLIGHRSDSTFNHIYYINLLQKYDQNKLEIHIPISYGDMNYAKKLKDYIREHHFNNVFFLEELIPRTPNYVEYLRSMDVALFDCDNSLALGNISMLLNLGKTIYLSRTGVIKKAFDQEHIPYHCLDEINSMSFEQFSSLYKINKNDIGSFRVYDFSKQVKLWHEIYEYLDSLNSKR